MSNQLLEIKGLSVHVEDKEILHGIDLRIKKKETHVLMGPNGTGKPTLGYALMGNPHYKAMAGAIRSQEKGITREASDKRTREGTFLSLQNLVEVSGLMLGALIRSAMEQRGGIGIWLWDLRKELEKTMGLLQMNRAYGDRDLNVDFSGGEKERAGIPQMLFSKPSLAVPNEADSGLNVDAVRTVSQGVKEYQKDRDGRLLIITHSARILESLQVDKIHIIVDGRAIKIGDASLVEQVSWMGLGQSSDEADQNSLCSERMEDNGGRKNICR